MKALLVYTPDFWPAPTLRVAPTFSVKLELDKVDVPSLVNAFTVMGVDPDGPVKLIADVGSVIV